MERKSVMSMCDLTEEEKKNMRKEIERFYQNVREEEIGMIGSQQILDFFLESLGSRIYNKALDDVHSWYKRMQDNMESDFFALYKE